MFLEEFTWVALLLDCTSRLRVWAQYSVDAAVTVEGEGSDVLGRMEDKVFAHVLGGVAVVELHDLRGVGLGNHPCF